MKVELKKKGNTSVYVSGNYTVVKFHNTEILKFNDRQIVMDSGGWQTVTTKARINQACQEYDLDGISVGQVDGNWYVYKGWEVIKDFSDGMIIKR